MASDFQRPRSMIFSGLLSAQRRAVAPPGRSERQERSLGLIPVIR